MAHIIESYFIDGNRRLQLGNEEFLRKMGFGANWQKIRIGMRLCFNDTGGNIYGGSFCVGVCEGIKGFKSTDCTGWVGWIPGAQLIATPGPKYPCDWTRNVAGYYASDGNGQVATKFGTGLTMSYVNMANLSTQIGFNTWTGGYTTTQYYVDLTKSGTWMTVRTWFAYASGQYSDRTVYQLMGVMDNESTPSAFGAISTYAGGLTYGSTINNLDTVSIVWERSTPTMEFSDIAVARYY